ncbi:chromosome partitioning protein ParB [Salimicrobium jeotgali]|uniref:Chromosome partitioning protein ParB n=1 Tax=Salimicrobium jeotgali TaxID=1230341 RepID=K2FKD3_9BACI|nr:ParB/RepB/Spo0J family partition protein [Salimicrobium jeotgali]AKG03341.1 chromosome partitioning protein ParB [Salimicrobium jeotgali]EKE31501.1 stage 0 sporulation protein J [Salimicrobium jeotgali]MBM7696710.1 ParB family chromosome partitioning protein [Salimicrobium jeotgali]
MAKGLGRGLNAFFSEEEASRDEQIKEVSLNKCRPNPYQPRKEFEEEAIEELKTSIEEHGILQPIIVRKSIRGYEIVVGERRFRAAKMAGLEKIPAVVREMTDQQMMELALLENLQREDLTALEEGAAYRNLMEELGVTQQELSERLGKSRSHIANLVRLLSLPPEITQKVNEGLLTMGHARALLSLEDDSKLLSVAVRIENEGLNVRQTEQLVSRLNQPAVKSKAKEKKDIFIQEREDVLKQRLGTGVKIKKGKKKGKIEIEFASDEDLERLLHWFDQ